MCYELSWVVSVPQSTAGVARFESENNPEIPTITGVRLTPARGGEAVIPGDEEGPEVVPTNISSRSPSPTDAENETFDSTTSPRVQYVPRFRPSVLLFSSSFSRIHRPSALP